MATGNAVIAIVRPMPLTLMAGAVAVNAANVLTADPKETATLGSGAGTYFFDFDLGSVQSIDTMFAGFVSPDVSQVGFRYGTVASTDTTLNGAVPTQASVMVNPTRHYLQVAAAPFNARYLRFQFTQPAGVAGTVGVVAAGKAFRPTWGHEFGAGRPIEDTGTAERLLSGGFGTYEGVCAGGYQWTFGDLSDAELEALYAIAMDRGNTRPVLVIEDPTQSSGLNERIHWSLFDRLEPYERQVPGASRYAFKVRDWV